MSVLLCPDHHAENGTTKCPESLCRCWHYHQGDVNRLPCEDITPRSWLLRTHSPDPTRSPSPSGLGLVRGVSAELRPAPAAGAGPFPDIISANSFPECLGPCHGGPVECTCLFLPPRHRPSPVHYRGIGFPALNPSKRFPWTDPLFETAAISVSVQAAHPVCSPPRSFLPLQLIAAGQPRLLRLS